MNSKHARYWGLALILIASLVVIAPALLADSLRDERARLKQMSAAEREELLRKENRFRNLSEPEQQRLRQIEQQIANAPDGRELRQIMTRYYEWLKTLSEGQRAEVLSLSVDERVSRIRKILEKQSIERFQRYARTKLDDDDVRVIKDWVEGFIDRHRDELVDSLPAERQREILRQRQPHARRWTLMGAVWRGEAMMPISTDELALLAEQLSPTARELLRSETDPGRLSLLIRSWLDAVLYASWAQRLEPVSTEELMRFLQEEVSDRERAELEKLPAEPFRREAERLYHHSQARKRWDQMRQRGPNFPGFNSGEFPDRRRGDEGEAND
jgi:hypothetical protein